MTNEATNEVMAFELIQESEYLSDDFGKAFFDCEMVEKMLLKMAERKDQQFKILLEKKLNEVERFQKNSIGLFPNDVIRCYGAMEVINEIISELFKED